MAGFKERLNERRADRRAKRKERKEALATDPRIPAKQARKRDDEKLWERSGPGGPG